MKLPLGLSLTLGALAAAGCAAGPWLGGMRGVESRAVEPGFLPVVERGPLVIHADFPLPADNLLITELVAERQLIADRLELAVPDRKVHLYLYADAAKYRGVVASLYPEFAERRAVFVDDGQQLSVYAHWSAHVAEDLRHEVAHGYLHAAAPSLPAWLDEGLAEYFEGGPQAGGLNAAHVSLLRRELEAGPWRPDLARLEATTAAAMTQLDYAEAWLWTHWLLGPQADRPAPLRTYLAELAAGGQPALLSTTLAQSVPGASTALVEHLRRLP